jgi:hypothetical protein
VPRLFVRMTGVWRQAEGWWMALSSTFPAVISRAAGPAIPGSIAICPSVQ